MNQAQEYVSVPTKVEAIQFTGDNFDAVYEFAGKVKYFGRFIYAFQATCHFSLPDFLHPGTEAELWVEANKKWLPIETGEWIIRDSLGCYPCKDDIFRVKYKELSS